MVPRPLPSVLIIHTGGTLGMDPVASFEPDVDGREKLKRGGSFKGTLGPGGCIHQWQVNNRKWVWQRFRPEGRGGEGEGWGFYCGQVTVID